MDVLRSTITNNDPSDGGGIVQDNSSGTIEASIISGNGVSGEGSGIFNFNYSDLTINNSTITNNYSSTGAALHNEYNSSTYIGNSIVALQQLGNDCNNINSSSTDSQGYNIDSDSSCGFTGTGDQQGVLNATLFLGPLADNNGPTLTHAITDASSVAVDTITIDGTNGCDFNSSVNQRRAVRAREVDGPNRGGSACDVGAYEFNSGFTPTNITLSQLSAKTVTPPGVWAALGAGLTALAAGWVTFWRKRRLT